MELVIKIPKELYESYKGRPPMLGDAGMDMIAQSIANGTPLPEGHWRLIDSKQAEERLRQVFDEHDGYNSLARYIVRNPSETPTIIEADTTRDCKTCGHSNDGKCAGTEECHDCMWENKYIEADKEGKE